MVPLAQIMACYLTAPSHYLNQCWYKIIGIHPSAISQKMRQICWQKLSFKINFFLDLYAFHLGQWVMGDIYFQIPASIIHRRGKWMNLLGEGNKISWDLFLLLQFLVPVNMTISNMRVQIQNLKYLSLVCAATGSIKCVFDTLKPTLNDYNFKPMKLWIRSSDFSADTLLS